MWKPQRLIAWFSSSSDFSHSDIRLIDMWPLPGCWRCSTRDTSDLYKEFYLTQSSSIKPNRPTWHSRKRVVGKSKPTSLWSKMFFLPLFSPETVTCNDVTHLHRWTAGQQQPPDWRQRPRRSKTWCERIRSWDWVRDCWETAGLQDEPRPRK